MAASQRALIPLTDLTRLHLVAGDEIYHLVDEARPPVKLKLVASETYQLIVVDAADDAQESLRGLILCGHGGPHLEDGTVRRGTANLSHTHTHSLTHHPHLPSTLPNLQAHIRDPVGEGGLPLWQARHRRDPQAGDHRAVIRQGDRPRQGPIRLRHGASACHCWLITARLAANHNMID